MHKTVFVGHDRVYQVTVHWLSSRSFSHHILSWSGRRRVVIIMITLSTLFCCRTRHEMGCNLVRPRKVFSELSFDTRTFQWLIDRLNSTSYTPTLRSFLHAWKQEFKTTPKPRKRLQLQSVEPAAVPALPFSLPRPRMKTKGKTSVTSSSSLSPPCNGITRRPRISFWLCATALLSTSRSLLIHVYPLALSQTIVRSLDDCFPLDQYFPSSEKLLPEQYCIM